ncbi:hypothetical protein L1987_65248 [Smallanthus sonchifolius]|uniref:Uncharacterized protein n=1 Tax=Smallanthus sonchifolius TaxID=185202 RepID=A0ACB9BU04_9ASTR|nr:hypothetical protein L1987_65248 [Smallanthus sonchifolius]
MSDNIPFEIQAQIIKNLPVKSLIQFRSVSKTWKSLIDSSDFVKHYSGQHTRMQHLVVTYDDPDRERKYVSIADDETLPQHKVSPTIPPLVSTLKYSTIIGTSHGLLCSYVDEPKGIAVIWNLLIGKSVSVDVPNIAPFGTFGTVVGFGVCPETMDPKIVKITHIDTWDDIESITSIPWQVEVFTLSAGAWRTPNSSNLPRKSIHFNFGSVVTDGTLYWLATDRVNTPAGYNYYILIISFDMTSEEFGEIFLPDSLARLLEDDLSIFKLRSTLAVLESYMDDAGFGVWMMLGGVYKSFIRLFTIKSPDMLVRGFRKSGEPIIEFVEHLPDISGVRCASSLVVYEPYAKDMIYLEINVFDNSFSVYPYTETLLLLDHPDNIIYDR